MVRRLVALCAILIVVLLCESLAANAMLKPLGRDEHMYCTAAVLFGEGKAIYRDFSYPAQLPYHPLLLAGVYRLFGTSRYLLAGRLVSVLCDVLVIISILAIYRRVFSEHRLEGLLFGLAAAVFYVFNPQVDYAVGHAWNHDVVILCVVLAFWLFTTVDFRDKHRAWRLAAMGALLTFATCARVTTSLVEVLFLAAIMTAAGGQLANRLKAVLPFLLAALAVAIWPVWVCAQAPRAAWLNLVRIPTLYGRWLHEVGMAHDKFTMTLFCLTEPGYLVFLAVGGYLLWTAVRRRSNIGVLNRRNLIVAVSLSLTFCVIAFVPPTMWEQYWAAPVPFLAIALAYPLAVLCRSAEQNESVRQFRMATWAVFIGATATVFANPAVLRRLREVTVTQQWTPIVLHNTSVDMVARATAPERVLTLGPLYALEGGGSIYPELASGSVVYRIADALTDSERALTQTVGPATVANLAEQSPPAAVVVGVEAAEFASLEKPLEESVGPDWLLEDYPDEVRAYFRP